MKILQLISSAGFYGAESMLVCLSQALQRSGCEVVVGVLEDSRTGRPKVANVAADLGIPVVSIPCDGRWDWRSVGDLRRAMRERRIEIVHTHGYKTDLYAWAATWGTAVGRVSTCHNWPDPSFLMQFYAKLDRVVLRTFDAVTTPSPVVAAVVRKSGIRAEKITVIWNGVEVRRFEDTEPTLRRELECGDIPIVGFVARFVPDKGGELLLQAAREVLNTGRRALFAFVGDGPSRSDWEAKARELGIGRNVVFTGVRHDLPGVYASMNIFVLPSLNEAMPMSILEAMSAGKPVIATTVGAIPKIVTEGDNGYLCRPGDVADLVQKLTLLLDNPALAAKFGEEGRSRVSKEYSSDEMARQYLRIYNGLNGAIARIHHESLSEL